MIDIPYGSNWDERADETINGKLMVDYENKFLIKYLTQESEILDVGGGTGIHGTYIQGKGFSIELVDIDEAALIKARKNGIKCHKLSGLEISSLGIKFDVVYCLDVPFLIGAKFSDFLEEVKKTSDIEGIFIFNFMPKYSYKNIIKNIIPRLRKSETSDYYLNTYSTIGNLLQQNGFMIVDIKTYAWLPGRVNTDSEILKTLFPVEILLRWLNIKSIAPRIIVAAKKKK